MPVKSLVFEGKVNTCRGFIKRIIGACLYCNKSKCKKGLQKTKIEVILNKKNISNVTNQYFMPFSIFNKICGYENSHFYASCFTCFQQYKET